MCIHIHRLRRDIPLWAFVSVWRSGWILLPMEQALADLAQFYILYTDLPLRPCLFSFASLLRFPDCLREFVSFCGRGFRPRRYTSSYEIASWSGGAQTFECIQSLKNTWRAYLVCLAARRTFPLFRSINLAGSEMKLKTEISGWTTTSSSKRSAFLKSLERNKRAMYNSRG